MLCIVDATIITPSRTINRGHVLVDQGRIQAVVSPEEIAIPENSPVVNGQGLVLMPGFIDLQFNGAFGHDLTHNPESLWRIGERLPRYGVTSFLPTIITSPLKTIRLAQSVWLQGPPADYRGAIPLGLHLEGPYLNPGKRGAHNPAFIRPPALDEVVSWSPEMGVSLVTLAPEMLGALDIIATLHERGVVISAGHSLATYDAARHGITAGIRYATHLFNAMPALNHREPGLIGAVLADERVTIGLIPDGLHVHPALVKLIWHMTGDGRLNLVTDAMAALGMEPGSYYLGDYMVYVSPFKATLPDGTLAGSVISLDAALRSFINLTGCAPAEAIRTITTTPATLLHINRTKGQILPGMDADMVLMTPDFQVAATFVGGRLVYHHQPEKRPQPKRTARRNAGS